MSLRNWLNSHPAAVTGFVVFVLAIAALAVYFSQRRSEEKAWYYDTGTGKLYARSSPGIEPVKGPSGQEAVRAYVFACRGGCSREGTRTVAYLEKYTDEARRMMAGGAPEGPEGGEIISGGAEAVVDATEKGHLVAAPIQNPEWVQAASPEGQSLIATAASLNCPAGEPREACRP